VTPVTLGAATTFAEGASVDGRFDLRVDADRLGVGAFPRM
jgi:hypothetical protein